MSFLEGVWVSWWLGSAKTGAPIRAVNRRVMTLTVRIFSKEIAHASETVVTGTQ